MIRIFLLNSSIFQIDYKYIILFHIFCFIFNLFFFLYLRRKYMSKVIPCADCQTKTKALNHELEPTGFAYNQKQDIFYSLFNCWQREYGYCKLYDEAAAALSMIIDCEPIRFDYNGKKWLIEFWKGQYGMTTGAEIGIYVTEESELDIPDFFHDTFYHSVDDEECLPMSFTLLKDNKVLFRREGVHWWLTGFKLGEYTDTESLSMEIRIAFPNTKMRNAFLNALIQAGYTKEEILIKHLTVFLMYDKPHTIQPYTRTKLSETVVQNSNEFYCRTYQNITKDYDNTLDKLDYLRVYSPLMYHHVFNIGKSKELYKDYNKLQDYINNVSTEKEES